MVLFHFLQYLMRRLIRGQFSFSLWLEKKLSLSARLPPMQFSLRSLINVLVNDVSPWVDFNGEIMNMQIFITSTREQ